MAALGQKRRSQAKRTLCVVNEKPLANFGQAIGLADSFVTAIDSLDRLLHFADRSSPSPAGGEVGCHILSRQCVARRRHGFTSPLVGEDSKSAYAEGERLDALGEGYFRGRCKFLRNKFNGLSEA